MSTPHPFDSAIALARDLDGALRGSTHPEWANMVGPFGGITAAVLLRAADLHPERHGDPLALTVNYVAPIVDGDFDVTAHPVRTNRTNQHWTLELSQAGEVKTTATAVFGLHRDTWSDVESTPPAAPAPEELPEPPGDFTAFVAWLRNYDMRFVAGPMPGPGDSPNPSSTTTLWTRDSRQRPLDYPALASLCDIFFPRIFLRRGQFVPAGTISVTMYFHASADELRECGADYVLGTATSSRFSGGYFDQSAQLWTRTGTLLATTHQLVYFKG